MPQEISITLNEKELERLREFAYEHEKGIIIKSRGCGIGDKIVVECAECDASEDITDYESW